MMDLILLLERKKIRASSIYNSCNVNNGNKFTEKVEFLSSTFDWMQKGFC